MKQITLLLAILVFAIIFSSYSNYNNSGTPYLSNVQIVVDDDVYRSPHFSPDDSKLVYSTIKSHGVYVVDLDKNKSKILTNLPSSGYRPTWTSNGEQIVFRHKIREPNTIPYFLTKAIDLTGNFHDVPVHVQPFNFFSATTVESAEDPIIHINDQTFQIEKSTLNTPRPIIITTEPGNYYLPILSPDKTKVLVHRGTEMLIFAADGSGLIKSLGNKGVAGSWSPDSQKILSFIDQSPDGHHISSSELYVTDITTGEQIQITNTPDVLEVFPDWSHDGTKIAYSDYKTGYIYTANIQL